MKDVAKLAGVSVATVSRVINNSSLVKGETARLVLDAIEKLEYQVNEQGRALRTNDSRLIGIIGAGMDNPFLAMVLKGIKAEALEKNYHLLYGDSDGELEQELYYLNFMKQRNVNGIIIISANINQRLVEEVRKIEIPVIFASGIVNDPLIPCVSVDNLAAAYEAVDYLLQKGHRRLGLIRGPYSDFVTSEERMKGARLAIKNNNISFQDTIVVEGDFSLKSGYEGAKIILTEHPDITAIFAFNDEMAIGAMSYIHDVNRKIPDDISVMGFDGIDLSEYSRPALTTVFQSGIDLGFESMRLLLRLLSGNQVQERVHYIPYQLVIRESTQ